jgi:hypothetical protein
LTTLNYATTVDSDEALATEKVAFDIHIEANKDSTLWKGTAIFICWLTDLEGGEQ